MFSVKQDEAMGESRPQRNIGWPNTAWRRIQVVCQPVDRMRWPRERCGLPHRLVWIEAQPPGKQLMGGQTECQQSDRILQHVRSTPSFVRCTSRHTQGRLQNNLTNGSRLCLMRTMRCKESAACREAYESMVCTGTQWHQQGRHAATWCRLRTTVRRRREAARERRAHWNAHSCRVPALARNPSTLSIRTSSSRNLGIRELGYFVFWMS